MLFAAHTKQESDSQTENDWVGYTFAISVALKPEAWVLFDALGSYTRKFSSVSPGDQPFLMPSDTTNSCLFGVGYY